MSAIPTPDLSVKPRVELLSKIDDKTLQFRLSGVDVSIANALRRILLTNIPMVVFRTTETEGKPKIISANTCGLTNEIVKHRLSSIPVHITNIEEFPIKNYILVVDVENNTDTTMIVTTKDFKIRDQVTGEFLPEDKVREILPANEYGDFIDFVRLRARPSEDVPPRVIRLTCEFDIGSAKDNGVYNAVYTCSYGNTIDTALQEVTLAKLEKEWKDAGKNKEEVEFEAENWKMLEGKRIFIKDSFDYVIQSVGVYTNPELMILATKIMVTKLNDLIGNIDNNELEIKTADSTMANSFDVILEGEDYTLGNVIVYFLLKNFYEKKIITNCSFDMLHPHDSYGVIRVAYVEPVETSTIGGHLKECAAESIATFEWIRKEFMKLVPR